MKKVVFIVYMPLTKKFAEDFYFKELENNNITVEYWDITTLFFNSVDLPNQLNSDKIIRILSYNHLRQKLKSEDRKNSLFITQITYEWRVWFLYFLISRFKIISAFFSRGALPTPILSNNRQVSIFNIKKQVGKGISIFIYLFTYLSKKYHIIKTPDYLFVAGDKGFNSIGIGSKFEKNRSSIININTPDYDSYLLECNQESRLINYKYVLFLDEYLPYHPDFKMFNMATIDPDRYFNRLNIFFDDLERKSDIKVVIAAHPKSDYIGNPFGDRELLKFQTNILVKHAEYVVAHMSTSISFAILYNKPLIFLISNDYMKINNSYLFNYTKKFAEETGNAIINIDNYIFEDISINEINTNNYTAYKYNYLTSKESENKESFNTFVSIVRNI